MPQMIDKYDAVVIGGGLFGAYAALYMHRRGLRVCLLEKEKQLFRKASLVNQARLHGGYHYPRSIATARMSDENKQRFTQDHRDFINFSFQQFYAIDRYGSLTDAAQFERFCQFLDIPCQPVYQHPLISMQRIEGLFLTEEYSFDPILIANYYTRALEQAVGIDLKCGVELIRGEASAEDWLVTYQEGGETKQIKGLKAINATYTATNSVNRRFGMDKIDLQHEISEIVLLSAPQLGDIGLTIMDGPFASLMPYGKTGLFSLSSVAYTHHKVSYDPNPHFSCQAEHPTCRPERPADCNFCSFRPRTAQAKMLAQIRQYFQQQVSFHYYNSLFTIKSKLQANAIDDGRPTEINQLRENPAFYCIFAGKINSIYEIEKVLDL